jgi:tetratricopeptide (TPR) repeat protein
MFITQTFATADFPSDYYDLTITLMDEKGNPLDAQTANFVLSMENELAHPTATVKSISLSSRFLFEYLLASQYDKMGKSEKAAMAFKKAYGLNPTYSQGIPEYAEFLLKTKKYGDALMILETLRDDPRQKFQYSRLRGQAMLGQERYAEAVESLLEANRIYDSDAGVLSALGYCYFKIGRYPEALNVLKASLKLNPQREDTIKLIQEISNRKKQIS